MSNIVPVAETGVDIPSDLARQYGIYLVTMHVTMGDRTLDDGTFPVEEIYGYYQRTGKLPKTSGCAPENFSRIPSFLRQKPFWRHRIIIDMHECASSQTIWNILKLAAGLAMLSAWVATCCKFTRGNAPFDQRIRTNQPSVNRPPVAAVFHRLVR